MSSVHDKLKKKNKYSNIHIKKKSRTTQTTRAVQHGRAKCDNALAEKTYCIGANVSLNTERSTEPRVARIP